VVVPGTGVSIASGLATPQYVALDTTGSNVYVTEPGSWNANASMRNSDGAILKFPTATGFTLAAPAATLGVVGAALVPTSGGSGYKQGDVLTLVDTSVACTGVAVNVLGACGSGGQVTVTAVDAIGAVTGCSVKVPGAGYTAATLLRAAGAGGVGFTSLITLDATSGAIATAPITTIGTGYTVGEVVNFFMPGAPGVAGVPGAVGNLVVTGVDAYGGVKTAAILSSGVGGNLGIANPVAALTTSFNGYLVANGLSEPRNIVVSGNKVYWTEAANSEPGKASVKSIGIGEVQTALVALGTQPILYPGVAIVSGLTGFNYFAIDSSGSYLYYTSGAGTLSRLAISGVSSEVVVSAMNGAQPFVIDSDYVYWGERSSGLPSASSVSVASAPVKGTVKRAPIAGGANIVIANDVLNPGGIAVDATNVYWLERSTFSSTLNGWNQDGKIMSHAK
jgi:hypothetical protein